MTPRLQALLGGLPDSLSGFRFVPAGVPSPHQSVAENVMLGAEPTRFGLIRRRELQERATDALAAVGWSGAATGEAARLDAVESRIVQLARSIVLARRGGHETLLIDDTRDELAADDNARWQRAVALAAQQIPVVIALTSLDGLSAEADGVLVRDGDRLLGPFDTQDAAAIDAAVGTALGGGAPGEAPPERAHGDVALAVHSLTVQHPVRSDRVMFRDVSFEVRAGEVLGLAGTHAHELLASLSGRGYGQIVSGDVVFAGASVAHLTRDEALKQKVVFITEHPLAYDVSLVGGIPSRISAERLRSLARTGVLDAAREYRPVSSESFLQVVGVGRPPARDQFERMLETLVDGEAKAVLIAEPLLGLGPDDRAERRATIDRIAAGGAAVVIAAGPDDLAACADRVALVVRGRIRCVIDASLSAARIRSGLVL